MAFIDEYITRGNITFAGLRNLACDRLSSKSDSQQEKLFSDLDRGKCIISDEDHLDKYLICYGNMHQAKLNYAFDAYPKLNEIFQKGIDVYDWGCGQGTATLSY